MSDDRLAEIKAWRVSLDDDPNRMTADDYFLTEPEYGFLETAPADIDWLVCEVERLRELVDSHRLGFQRRNLELLEQTERLRGLLARLEWHDGPFGFCPICGGRDPGKGNLAMLKVRDPGWQWGHAKGCDMAAELHR